MSRCLCSHSEPEHCHGDDGKRCKRSCGCDCFRDPPPVAEQAERWLASREAPATGKSAPRTEDGAA